MLEGLVVDSACRSREQVEQVHTRPVTIRLLPGAARDDAVRRLADIRSELTTLGSGTDQEAFLGYGRWALESARMVTHCLPADVIDELIFTLRYWTIQNVGGSTLWDTHPKPQLRSLITAEIADRDRALQAVNEQLSQELLAWEGCGHLVLADTGVFLQHLHKFDEVSWRELARARSLEMVTLVVPVAVIRELDRKKRQSGTIRWRAAYSLSKIENLFGERPVAGRAPVLTPASPFQSVSMGTGSGEVRIRVLLDELGHVRASNTDDEIIFKAVEVKSWSGQQVKLATFDTTMAFQARQAGLDVIKLGGEALAEEFRPRAPKGERNASGIL